MSATEKQILIFSFYRDAELRGARLLFNLLGHSGPMLNSRCPSICPTRPATHGSGPSVSPTWAAPRSRSTDGYQRRLGLRVGVPKNIVDLLALTVVVEERAQSRYMAHAALPGVDAETMEVLKAVTEDETWHLSWIERKMREIAREDGDEARADEALARYRAIDREVYATLAADEAQLMRT